MSSALVLTPECEHVPQDWRRTSNKIIMTRIFRTINQVFTKIAGDNADYHIRRGEYQLIMHRPYVMSHESWSPEP